jgi:hypothetical protein
MFVGLVKDPGAGWGLPDESAERPRRRVSMPAIPWRALVWLAVVVVLFALVPTVGHRFGAFAGYLLLLVGVTVGVWRIDRCFSGQWRGLRDYQA